MFEALTQKISKIFNSLASRGKLSEKDVDEALRQIRLALLEADVNFRVVKSFLAVVRERALTARVLESLTPAQQIIKIVNEELIAVLGKEQSRLMAANRPPSVAMLVGLQGSGKTTTAAKLAAHLKQSGQRPLLVAADTRRPAAIEQLVKLGHQIDIPVFTKEKGASPLSICMGAMKRADEIAANWVLIDTQGRLHVDEILIAELAQLKREIKPVETLLVVDAMTGQDAVNVAEAFNSSVGLTGLILTKTDGDARGGAALSIRFVTGVSIKFIGTGEKPSALEPFYPERMASRILGMGDVMTLIEKAEKTFDEKKAKQVAGRIRTATFSLDDFLWQLRQVRKMGTLAELMEMMPGFSKLVPAMVNGHEEDRLKKIEAIVLSMTPEERYSPAIINGSRKRRIARGSGTNSADVNQLISQFYQVQKFTKMAASGTLPKDLMGTLRKR
ncbi:MAG: signal recognition particle protein [Chloroflexi bacterium]|nr:signal recognition particle protein [Chloroflexota bacterium]